MLLYNDAITRHNSQKHANDSGPSNDTEDNTQVADGFEMSLWVDIKARYLNSADNLGMTCLLQ